MAVKPRCTYFDLWSKQNGQDVLWQLAERLAERHLPETSPIIKIVGDRDVAALLQFSVSYTSHVSVPQLMAERQILALFSKNADIDLGVDRETVAWETFAKAELQCKSTNRTFRECMSRDEMSPAEKCLISNVSRKISRILGDVPALEDLHLRFGPGTNVGCRNKNSSALAKLDAEPTCSREARKGLQPLWATIPQYAYFHKGTASVVPGKLAFVPKDAKTDRSIMVEPILNTFVQLGIGSYMKRRLKAAGCNLYSQHRNRELARVGSITGTYATVDLSSASDTIASLVVLELLPYEWVELLSTWRTGTVTYKPKHRDKPLVFEMEKFSSMGNGFTFELETTIFYAIALQAVADAGSTGDVSVYGDDIIVPSDAYDVLVKYLSFFGFTPNQAKSFKEGPFRESCGADWYQGINVRPFYVKDRLTSARVVGLLNFDFRGAQLFGQEIRQWLISLLPPAHRTLGPSYCAGASTGDGHIASDDFVLRPYRRERGWSGGTYLTVVKQARRLRRDYPAYDLYPSYATYSGASRSRESDPYVLRGGDKAKVTRVYTLGLGNDSSLPGWACESPFA